MDMGWPESRSDFEGLKKVDFGVLCGLNCQEYGWQSSLEYWRLLAESKAVRMARINGLRLHRFVPPLKDKPLVRPLNRSKVRHSGPGFRPTGVTDPESRGAPLDSRFHGNDEIKNGFTFVLRLC